MTATSQSLLELEIPCDQEAPGRVRHALLDLEAIGPVRDDALLVASELVTNAVLHSGCAMGDPISVCVSRSDHALVISVADPGFSGDRAEPRAQSDGSPGGWGLRLVGELAARWGAKRNHVHLVWAELGLPV